MDQASRIISRWAGASGIITPERLACAAWKKAVGNRISAHARALKLIRTSLVIEVEDEVWRQQLWSLRHPILRNLEKSLGAGIVTDIEFRIVPPRREPQRATAAVQSAAPPDEADAIPDPGLRRIYKAARRRETA